MEKELPRRTLVLGGAASGKSAWGERFVTAFERSRIYIATAQPFDPEMVSKIERHKSERGPEWTTIEAPQELGSVIASCPSEKVAVLDCATIWLSNRLLAGADLDIEAAALALAFRDAPCPLTIVSNELGDGIVPADAMSRAFRTAHGRMNQRLAAEADLVVRVTAGLPQILKGALP